MTLRMLRNASFYLTHKAAAITWRSMMTIGECRDSSALSCISCARQPCISQVQLVALVANPTKLALLDTTSDLVYVVDEVPWLP